ncbi:hypothetical protein [Moorena bouillonii]|uniref:hypothetical protein n=1 Tax=Moorena bouillonii TaxID=207920 RepID=UPI00117F5ACF|nr:hypothetical protein [Moorena bouillonii]
MMGVRFPPSALSIQVVYIITGLIRSLLAEAEAVGHALRTLHRVAWPTANPVAALKEHRNLKSPRQHLLNN